MQLCIHQKVTCLNFQLIQSVSAEAIAECRYDKKDLAKWKVIGPRVIDRHSVISQGKYETSINTPIKKIN